MSKYSIPDDCEWADEKRDAPDQGGPRTKVKRHEVDVILTTDPSEDMGYGREKWTAHVIHDERGAWVLFATKHRWKGNFWRETYEHDWREVPLPVRKRVASVVACDGHDDLTPEHRLVEEDGQNIWERRREAERRANGEP